MMKYRLTYLRWQIPISATAALIVAACLWWAPLTGANVSDVDRATLITLLTGVASMLALFCSISIAFVLFISQSNRAERIAAYDLFKSRLNETRAWLLNQSHSEHREVCLSLAFEFDKHDLADLPQTDWGDEYRGYCKALAEGLKTKDNAQRTFWLISSTHFGYIEHLLSRIALIAVRQIVAKRFIDTLTKGVGVICISVVTLLTSAAWYSEGAKLAFIAVATFCSVAAILLFYEFCLDMYREYDEELEFVDRDGKES